MEASRPTKILALSPEHYARVGGLATYLRDTVSVLRQRAPVTFLGRSTQADKVPDFDSGTQSVLAASSRRAQIWKAILWAMRCRLRRQSAFTLCGHLYLAPLAGLIRRLAGGRTLLVLLGVESWQTPPRAATRRAAPHFDQYVSVSRFTADRFASWSGVARDHIRIIHPAVDPEPFRAITPDDVSRCRAELEIGDRPALLTVARLDGVPERKGHHRVLEVLPSLRDRHPRMVYLIAGDGPGRSSLERQAARQGLGETVRFLGPVSETDKAVFYRMADAFVLPSEGEGFGIALAEAAVCRLPIVYSRRDASAEAVTGTERTWDTDPRSPPELVRAIDFALRSGRQSPAIQLPVKALPHVGVEAFEEAWRDFGV